MKKFILGFITVGLSVLLLVPSFAFAIAETNSNSASAKQGVCNRAAKLFSNCRNSQGQGNCSSSFIDEDGDGICDNWNTDNCPKGTLGQKSGQGIGQSMSQNSQKPGFNYTDEDGDGICDNATSQGTSGNGNKTGMGNGYGAKQNGNQCKGLGY